tara:strand:- start:748 stop:1098 length:351 start_codon:yes stop_codon:yes gene_type:complete
MSRFDQSGPGFDEEPLSWVEPDGINDYDRQIEELTRMFMEREMSTEHVNTMLAFVAEQIADNIYEPEGLMDLLYYNFTASKGVSPEVIYLMKSFLKQHVTKYVDWDYHDLVHLLDQ